MPRDARPRPRDRDRDRDRRFAGRPRPSRPAGPYKHGPLPVIGLVGGIGAGKSLVAAQMAERGALVLDADKVGHALLDQTPSRDEVIARFGEAVLGPEPEGGGPRPIDRKALGAIVFAHPSELRDLERILHPRMRRTFEKAIARAGRRREAPAVVLDAAILFAAGWNTLCDVVAFVDAPAEQRQARVAAARGWTAEQLAAREQLQRPLDETRRRAEVVLTNDGPPEVLAAQVDALLARFARPRRSPATRPPRP